MPKDLSAWLCSWRIVCFSDCKLTSSSFPPGLGALPAFNVATCFGLLASPPPFPKSPPNNPAPLLDGGEEEEDDEVLSARADATTLGLDAAEACGFLGAAAGVAAAAASLTGGAFEDPPPKIPPKAPWPLLALRADLGAAAAGAGRGGKGLEAALPALALPIFEEDEEEDKEEEEEPKRPPNKPPPLESFLGATAGVGAGVVFLTEGEAALGKVGAAGREGGGGERKTGLLAATGAAAAASFSFVELALPVLPGDLKSMGLTDAFGRGGGENKFFF